MSQVATCSDIEEIQESWSTRGFSCNLWNTPPGGVWEDFIHDTDELIRVLDGELEVLLPAETVRLHPGEEVLVPSEVMHTVRPANGKTPQWLFGFARDHACTD